MGKSIYLILFTLLLITVPSRSLYSDEGGAKYHSPSEVTRMFKDLAKGNKKSTLLHTLCQTPGGRDMPLLSLGTTGEDVPAILVIANMEGNCHVAHHTHGESGWSCPVLFKAASCPVC